MEAIPKEIFFFSWAVPISFYEITQELFSLIEKIYPPPILPNGYTSPPAALLPVDWDGAKFVSHTQRGVPEGLVEFWNSLQIGQRSRTAPLLRCVCATFKGRCSSGCSEDLSVSRKWYSIILMCTPILSMQVHFMLPLTVSLLVQHFYKLNRAEQGGGGQPMGQQCCYHDPKHASKLASRSWIPPIWTPSIPDTKESDPACSSAPLLRFQGHPCGLHGKQHCPLPHDWWEGAEITSLSSWHKESLRSLLEQYLSPSDHSS